MTPFEAKSLAVDETPRRHDCCCPSERVDDSRQGQRECRLHLFRKPLPTHPVHRVSAPQPLLPHHSGVFVGHFQHFEVTPHSVVLIVPTELGGKQLMLLGQRPVQIGFTPLAYPAQEAAQPFALGFALDGPPTFECLGPVVR